MSWIYFDITDVIDFARHHRHVTGIQRFQIRVLQEMVGLYGSDKIRCSFLIPNTGAYYAVHVESLFPQGDADLSAIPWRIARIQDQWPLHPHYVRQQLKPHSHTKLLRSLHKVRLHMAAAFRALRCAPARIQRAQLVRSLSTHDKLVFLGASQLPSQLRQLAIQHRDSGGEVVQLMHDLIPHVAPQFFPADHVASHRQFLDDARLYASRFFCVSRSTERDLRTLAFSVPPRITTVPLAHEFGGFLRGQRDVPSSNPEMLAFTKTHAYVLCVGTIEIRKNGARLLNAWQNVVKRHSMRSGTPKPHLVFAGKVGWQTEEFFGVLQSDPELAQCVILFSNCNDQDLAHLYGHCLFSVYPSLYEGWGLPVGESAWFHRLCIASATSSIPEVCGDLLIYFDPEDVNDLTAKLNDLIENPTLVADKEKALGQAHLRTWRSVAKDIYTALSSPS